MLRRRLRSKGGAVSKDLHGGARPLADFHSHYINQVHNGPSGGETAFPIISRSIFQRLLIRGLSVILNRGLAPAARWEKGRVLSRLSTKVGPMREIPLITRSDRSS